MKKILLFGLAVLLGACASDAPRPVSTEVYQCGDYTVFNNIYADKTDDLSGGAYFRDGMEPHGLDSSAVITLPIINGGEVLANTLKTPDKNVIFQLLRFSDGDRIVNRRAIFNDDGLFRGEKMETDCEFQGLQ